MKAFLPSSTNLRTPRGDRAIPSNVAFLNSRAAADAVRATTAAADAILARPTSSSVATVEKASPPRRKTATRKNTLSPKKHHDAPPSGPMTAPTTAMTGGSKGPFGDVEVFPTWIRERKDFQVFFPRYADRVITDDEILRQGIPKEPNDRNIVELQCLARWIMKIPSMQTSLDLNQATEIAKLARYQVFRPREYVFRKGDLGDACYLVFSGEVNVLIDGEKVATVGKNAAFGDIALQIENATRGADVQAAFNTNATNGTVTGVEVLKIMAEDYHKTLARCQSRRRKHLITWLHTEVVLFRDCVESKLHFFELVSIDIPLKRGEVLYRQGDSVGAFYIVRSGRVRLEVDIKYEHKHRWPSGKHEWDEETRAIKSRIPFHVEEPGGYFGFEMFVENQPMRAYTVIADTPNVELVALNRVDCFSPYFSFTTRAIEKIVEKHDKYREMSLRQIQQKLRDYHRITTKQKKSLRAIERLPLVVQTKFRGSTEQPDFQFPTLQASTWEAPNEVVRALQLACQ